MVYLFMSLLCNAKVCETSREPGYAPINASDRPLAAVKAARSAPKRAALTVASQGRSRMLVAGRAPPSDSEFPWEVQADSDVMTRSVTRRDLENGGSCRSAGRVIQRAWRARANGDVREERQDLIVAIKPDEV
jgi:hypothetical protein